jgi:hypothetical protein
MKESGGKIVAIDFEEPEGQVRGSLVYLRKSYTAVTLHT